MMTQPLNFKKHPAEELNGKTKEYHAGFNYAVQFLAARPTREEIARKAMMARVDRSNNHTGFKGFSCGFLTVLRTRKLTS